MVSVRFTKWSDDMGMLYLIELMEKLDFAGFIRATSGQTAGQFVDWMDGSCRLWPKLFYYINLFNIKRHDMDT